MQHCKEGGERHRDGGSPRSTCDSHVESEDKQGIETDVEHCTRHQHYHRLVGIARRTHQRNEVKRHGGQEHTRKHYEHVFSGVSHSLGCRAKHEQYLIEENIRKQHHQATQNDSENDAVAEDMLSPVDVFLAQNYRHPRPCSNANQSSESVDDVDYRQGDG